MFANVCQFSDSLQLPWKYLTQILKEFKRLIKKKNISELMEMVELAEMSYRKMFLTKYGLF